MFLNDIKIEVSTKYFTPPNKKVKGDKGSCHSSKIASFEMGDYGISEDNLTRLVDVLQDEVFSEECVELKISATSTNF